MDSPKTLLFGFGNSTRGDDGAGWEVVCLFDLLPLPGLETRFSQQLGLELLEDWGDYERVMFVDAAPGGDEVRLEKIEISESTPAASTHALKPETLLRLSRELYGKCPELYLCRIPAEQFGFGEGFSPATRRHIGRAVRLIKDWLNQPMGRPDAKAPRESEVLK